MFEDRAVLVEQRTTTENKYEAVKEYMQSLALLLSNLDSSFASLGCIGLAVTKKTSTISLVYAAPKLPSLAGQDKPELKNLYELIPIVRKCSLRDRMRIGLILAEAVLQLHTAGWLHKSIRSENILFVAESGCDATAFLTADPI